MKYANLIRAIEKFYKIAGTLEYPVKMHQEILKWATSVYCSYAVDDLNEVIESGRLKGEVLKKAKNFKAFLLAKTNKDDSASKQFKLDLSDVGFLSEDFRKMPNLHKQHITVVFLPYTAPDTSDEPEQLGEFDPASKTITINKNIPEQMSPSAVNADLEDLSNTIRHELQHLVQYYAQTIKGVSWQNIGMPSTKIAPEQSLEEESELPARLRNIEFHSHLSDTIENLKKMFQLFPKRLHKSILDTLIGNMSVEDFIDHSIDVMDEMNPSEEVDYEYLNQRYYLYLERLDEDSKEYRMMRSEQPEKYNKLLKEVYKGIEGYL